MSRYKALFDDVSWQKLVELQVETGEMDDAQEYIEGLLIVLAAWRQDVIDAARRNPGSIWAKKNERDYNRAAQRVFEAWTQCYFRSEEGQPTIAGLPDSFQVPPAEVQR
jgi:hypothetical protein